MISVQFAVRKSSTDMAYCKLISKNRIAFRWKVEKRLNSKIVDNFRQANDRVEFKLASAEYFLQKLVRIEKEEKHLRGPSHLEAEIFIDCFLFEIIGVIDAFLQEINITFKTELSSEQVTLRTLRKKLPRNKSLQKLEKEEQKRWLKALREYRNHTVHRSIIRKHISLNLPPSRISIYLLKDPKDPNSGPADKPIIKYFEQVLEEMGQLLDTLYSLAIKDLKRL